MACLLLQSPARPMGATLVQDPAPARVNAAGVNAAIDKAKEFLYSKQGSDGTWEFVAAPLSPDTEDSRGSAAQSESIGQWGGRTAVVVYALLAAGEDVREPKLAKAIEFLKTAELTGVYAVGIRLMALSYLPMDDAIRRTVQRDGDILLQTLKTEGDAAGHYDYNVLVRKDDKSYSHSRSQYGVLGMWAAGKMGYKVDPRYWQLVDAGWRRNQLPSGGWNYNSYSPGEQYQREQPGMTAAGIASLMITNEFLLGDKATGCNGNLIDPDIEEGLGWLAANFEKLDPEERFRQSWTYITLYNVERLSVMGGLRYIGPHDWYGLGAGWLLDKQRRDGSWRRPGSGGGEQVEVVDTAFSLLFLARGRSPLVAAKLAHVSVDPRGRERKADWNQRPRDLANLAEYIGDGLERELHWQVLDPARSVEEWLDAPILYISGSTPLNFDDELKAKIRRYSGLGGLIVFNADCGRQPFASSAAKLGRELFSEYDFRVLEPSHPVFNMQYPLAEARGVPRVQALGNGARELMILIPGNDAGRSWQVGNNESALKLGANLYLYAIDSNGMRYKGARHVVEKDPAARPNRKAVVGRMHYDGNWNPEPGGWDRLAAVMHNEYDVVLETRSINPGSEPLEGIDLLHLTGTADFELSQEARDAVGKFVEAGGTLLIDAAGGSSAFAAAVDREMRLIFDDAGEALEAALPADHALFAERDGLPPLEIAYRTEAMKTLGTAREPRIRGIDREGRLAVIYSPHDLSVGLVGMPVAGIVGYAPETATGIVARVIREVSK